MPRRSRLLVPNVVGGKILYEKDQILVVAGCDSRDVFYSKRERVRVFVERMGDQLDQESVFVLAYPSDSFLIELHTEKQG